MADEINPQLLAELKKAIKANQTLARPSEEATDIKALSGPTRLNNHNLSIEQDLLKDDLSRLELPYGKGTTGPTHYPTPLKYFDLIKPIFPEILRSALTSVWSFLAGATRARIRNNNPDVASSFVKGGNMHHSSESTQLENFLVDLENSPNHSQQTFFNQLISRCVLRLARRDNSNPAVFSLQEALGEDVHQDIRYWRVRLQGAVYRVLRQPLHPLLSSFNRRDLAQRTVELLQRELDSVKAPKDIRNQQAPIPPTSIQFTGEQQQQLWDLGVGINPSVNKRAPEAIQIPQKEIDSVIEKAREHSYFPPEFYGIDTSKVYSFIFRRVRSGLTPDRLNSLNIFIISTLEKFPILACITDFAIAETLYWLWFAGCRSQYLDQTHLDIAQDILEVLPDRLQHAQPREVTVVILLGLRTIADILEGGSDRPPALNPYVAFCSLMRGSPSPDKDVTLDNMCLSMLAELRQLQAVDLEQFATCHMDGTESDVAMSLQRCYFQYRLANPPVGHRETVHHLGMRSTADSRQAHQALLETTCET